MDLIEAEDVKERCQVYTELYKKKKKKSDDPDNHDSVITQ